MTDSQKRPELGLTPADRWVVAGAVWGPGLFILAWVVSGLLTEGYSPVDEHISELAAVHSPTRALMTAGLVAYVIGVGTSAWPLRKILGTLSAVALGLSAVFTFGVVLTPSGRSSISDFLHGGFAVLLYLFLSTAGPMSYSALRRRSVSWSITSVAVGVMTAGFLWISLDETSSGLFQRLGLTTADLWVMAVGWAAARATFKPLWHH